MGWEWPQGTLRGAGPSMDTTHAGTQVSMVALEGVHHWGPEPRHLYFSWAKIPLPAVVQLSKGKLPKVCFVWDPRTFSRSNMGNRESSQFPARSKLEARSETSLDLKAIMLMRALAHLNFGLQSFLSQHNEKWWKMFLSECQHQDLQSWALSPLQVPVHRARL